jgi:hypothetical protein
MPGRGGGMSRSDALCQIPPTLAGSRLAALRAGKLHALNASARTIP